MHVVTLVEAAAVLMVLLVIGILLWANWRMRIARHTAEQARAQAMLARERAEAADSAKSAFLATVSHEIRTPMNGVIGVIDILRDTPLNCEQQRYLGIAAHSARLLLRVINDILDYAKIESGALQLNDAPYDFYYAMENMAQLHLALARRKGLALDVAIMPHFDRHLIGDDIRLSQVIANLLGNAVAYTQHGRVTLSARRCLGRGTDHMEIIVRDTGVGMSRSYQQRLFSPFQQEDTSTTRRHGGTGLGLSIVKQLVERMGGTIHIDSRPGAGTLAQVRVPARWGEPARTWPRYPGRTAVLNIGNPAMVPALRAWLRKMHVRIVSATEPCDVRIEPGDDGGFMLAATAVRLGPIHTLDPFLQGLADLWGGKHIPARLPAPAPEFAASPILPAPAQAAHENSLLLVEDNEINRDITLRQLALLGIPAVAAPDGEAGYAAWLQQQPRAMLVDCHMPKLDGYELARRIRTREMIVGCPRTTLIGFSANATQADAQACRAAGMDDYLAKPATREKLQAVLQRTGLASLAHLPTNGSSAAS